MYLPLVMIGYAAGLLLLLLGSRAVERAIPGLRGLRELQWAIVAGICSVLLIGSRPWAPQFLSILFGNYCLFLCFFLIYVSAARVTREAPRHRSWLLGLIASAAPAISYWTWVRPNLVARIVVNTELLAVISGFTAFLLFSQRSLAIRDSAKKLAWLQIVAVVFLTARSVLSCKYQPRDFVNGDLVQTGFTFGQLILCLATICGMIWLAICDRHIDLESVALTDGLSGLLNRRAFDEILTRELERSSRGGPQIALLLLDIDRFKLINDTHGHPAGDRVIRWTSDTLKRTVRPGDTVARYGGEEFAVLLRNANVDQACTIAERLRCSIEQQSFQERSIHVTASLGVAICKPPESAAELFDRCDGALYRSKKEGRNRVSFAYSGEESRVRALDQRIEAH